MSLLLVGCIQVYLYDTVLLLRAAQKYPVPGGGDGAFVDEDPLAHITNTARQAEDDTFREEDRRAFYALCGPDVLRSTPYDCSP